VSVGASRTWLFVPGTRPDRFAKAAASGADEVILDLEDAVSAPEKPQARQNVATWLSGGGRAWVRVNAVTTAQFHDDVEAIRHTEGLQGVVLPKAEDPLVVGELAESLPLRCGVVPLVETALGVHRALELARCGIVMRLAFGSLDYAQDIEAGEGNEPLLLARSALVQCSRVAGIAPPIDGVTTVLTDLEAVGAAARYARLLGFGAKLCIHPKQIEPVRDAFAPDAGQIEWARAVLAVSESGSGVATLGDEMIDRPVIERARRVLVNAREPAP
jgi:citrate lyase subunit beta/citryl-CoA lyase